MKRMQLSRRLIGGLLAAALTALGLPAGTATAAGGPNLALGKPLTASGSQAGYPPGNATDGNQASYWESVNNAFPQWLQVDLGSAISIDQVVLKLPTTWGSRTQTLSVLGSTTGSDFTTLSASGGRLFNQSTGNTVTINFTAATVRYVRLNFTANTGWPLDRFPNSRCTGPPPARTRNRPQRPET